MKDWWSGLEKGRRWLVAALGAWWAGWFVYLLSPIDLVPDFLLGVGQTDDFIAFLTTLVATVLVVREVRGGRLVDGFGELVPDALRPRSVEAPAVEPDAPESTDPHEAELDGHGDNQGIDGYRPLSIDELKAL